MENLATPWSSWCRLCAKENVEDNVNINLIANHQPLVEDVRLNLNEALEKYFLVQSSCEDLLPKHLCLDCYSLISSLMVFNERVMRVQQMYKFMLENPMHDACDLRSVRIKFDICDDNKEKWFHSQNETGESLFDNAQKSKVEYGEEGLTVHIKQENGAIISEYEEKNDVDNGNVNFKQLLYDDEYIDNDIQEDEHRFEIMSKDFICAEDGEINNDASPIVSFKRTNSLEKNNTKDDFVIDKSCKECGQQLYLYSTYCEHMEKLHDNASKDKCCPICNQYLQTWYHLGRHMRVHMPLEYRRPVKCTECEDRFTCSSLLEVHINEKHRKKNPFICGVCGFSGGTKFSLTQHMDMHTDNAPFECEVCKKKFKRRARLNLHMDIHRPNKLVCTVCGLHLKSRATLKNHLLVHSNKLQHKCDYCGKAFKQSKYLKNHLLLHTGLKPYSCNFCDLTFAVRSLCRIHIRKTHPDKLDSLGSSDIKAYSSNIPKLETLKVIVKAADNLRPIARFGPGCFRCEFCDRKFNLRSDCRSHMKQMHPDDLTLLEASGKMLNEEAITTVDKFGCGKTQTCNFCDRAYTNPQNCRRHIRRAHSAELAAMATSGNNVKDKITKFKTPKANKRC